MARLLFSSAALRLMPPWLRRSIGGRVVQALADPLDTLTDRVVAGVKLRFPNGLQPDALGLIGRERRIPRGPRESAATYATRLLTWWDDHRGRGGAYALLRQLFGFWRSSLNVRMDVVAYSGLRHWVDELGVITRDSITWDADGSGHWARLWIFFYLDGIAGAFITDSGGELISSEGDLLAALLLDGTISADDAEDFRVVPRDWVAAHIEKTTIVLLYGKGGLWDYPQPVGTWDDDPTAVWDENPPVLLEIPEA